jgi:multidrug efflux pump
MLAFWKFFIDKHHFTILLGVVLVLGGVYALIAIPKESSPEVQIPVGVVTTVLPGASAQDVEQLITDKIEDHVIGIANVSKVTSTSGDGVSSVTVEFEANADIDKSIQLLKDEVDKAKPELPEEATDPSVTDVNFADQPILIISISGNLAPAELTALGKTAADEIDRISGVSRVVLSGAPDREVQVIVRAEKLRQYGLSLSDVTNAIRVSGIAAPAGTITVDGVTYAVRLSTGLTAPETVARIAIAGPGGTPLMLRDVADVRDGLENASTYSRVSVDGSPSLPALTLSVYKNRGGNIVETGTAVKEKLTELEATGPLAGTHSVISYDAADEVAHDLGELTRAGIETVVLVMIVLLLTLGWRESIVAALSVPLSFLIAFIGLYAAGNTINFVSLFSLILAIGILVDTGIVVVEAIHTRLVKYGDKRAAAIAALKEYAWPLIAGTFTTIAVFIPLFFLSGVTGKFIASIPFTVIFVLLASIFVALGLVPLIGMYMIRGELSPMEKRQEEWNEKAAVWYEGFLRKILGDRKLENRFLIGIVSLFVVALMLPAFGAVQSVFFPADDSDIVTVEIERPQGTELSQTDLSVREVEEILYADKRIESFVTEVGAGNSFAQSGLSGSKAANITISLVDEHEDTDRIVSDLRKQLSVVSSARITVDYPKGGPPSGNPISISFVGDDLGKLNSAVERAAAVLTDVPGATNITTSTKDSNAEFVVVLDTAKASERGVSPAVVADTLRTALYGAKATSIRQGSDDIEVWVKLALNPNYLDPSEVTHTTIESVRDLTIEGTQGPVALGSIANVSFEPANASIKHEDGSRIVTLSAGVAGGETASGVTTAFVNAMKKESLPEGVSMKVGGEAEDVNQSFAEMGIALLAGAALMLAILILEFNSFRHSLYLLAIIPLSLIGVLVGLMLTGQPLSFPSMLGVIALAGVIINHAIILMDSIARIGREEANQTLTDVVVKASVSRLRPIVLTTVTTVVGMIPLSLVSALWGPLAISIMFGLAFSMVLTLVLIPVLYHRWPGKAVAKKYRAEEVTS